MISPPLAQSHAARAARLTWRHATAARAFEALGWRSGAAWAYRRALRRHASAAELHLRLGETLGAMGRWDEATHAFRHAARLRPRCEEACGNLALALHRVGRDQAALEVLQALGALHPQRAELHLLLGAWLRRRRRSAEALRAFRDALAAEPVPATTRFFLGEALLGVDEWRALVAAWEHARRVTTTATRADAASRRPGSARPQPATPRPGARERMRHAAQRALARITQAALAHTHGAGRLARRPWRLALLIAGRWHARAGRAALAIRCFRGAQALRGHSLSRPLAPVSGRRPAPRRVAHVPLAVARPALARRRPVLS